MKSDHKISTDLGVVETNKRDNSIEGVVPTAETGTNVMHGDAKPCIVDQATEGRGEAGRGNCSGGFLLYGVGDLGAVERE